MSKQFDSRRLDVVHFAEEQGELTGKVSLAHFDRLLAEAAGDAGESVVNWWVHGELRQAARVQAQVWLHLRAEVSVPLVCQRCLEPVQVPVEVDRWFRFVDDEQMAEAQDDESDEDVLAQSRSFDLLSLIEDELLMALPLAPRHAACPTAPKLSAGEREFEAALSDRQNPFAVLGRLKGKS